MSESIADSVNGTRIPIFSGPRTAGAGDGDASWVAVVQAETEMTTSVTRSAGHRPALLDDRLLRGVDELVGVGLREIDVGVLLDVLVELLQQAELELRSALGHL